MSKSSKLIERMEKETGQRVGANGGDNVAMDGLFGAMARILNDSQHREKDDVAARLLIRHGMTPEYTAKQREDRMLGDMLASGLSPDDVIAILGSGDDTT